MFRENISNSRKLRKILTPHEQTLWSFLRNRKFAGMKFRRQHPIGFYIVDFVCDEVKLIIELDGSQHLTPEQSQADERRDRYFNERGYKVVRIWNSEIDDNLLGVFKSLYEAISPSTGLRPPPFYRPLFHGVSPNGEGCLKRNCI